MSEKLEAWAVTYERRWKIRDSVSWAENFSCYNSKSAAEEEVEQISKLSIYRNVSDPIRLIPATELEELKADNENLIWNLAGCSTFALGWQVNELYDEKSARPALKDVRELRLKYEALKKAVIHLRDTGVIDDRGMETLRAFAKSDEKHARIVKVLEGE